MSEPTGSAHRLSRPFFLPATSTVVDVHRFAVVPGMASAAVKWLDGHPPRGSTALSSGGIATGGTRTISEVMFSWPTKGAVIEAEWLQVQAVQLMSPDAAGAGTSALRTGLRIDATVEYYKPRPASTVVGRGATEMTVVLTPERLPGHAPGARATTHDARTIAAVIAAFNRAHFEPIGMTSCTVSMGGVMTLQFRRSSGGAPYATVVADAVGCQTMEIVRHGRPVAPLLAGVGFVRFVEHELHMHVPVTAGPPAA